MTLQAALERLRELRPRTGPRGGARAANAHVHLPPNFSAFAALEEAIEQADREGLRLLGASNYYDYSVYGPFVAQALDRSIYPLLGMELVLMDERLQREGLLVNDPGNPGKTYLCGKAVVGLGDPSPEASEVLDQIRERDGARMAEMADALDGEFVRHGAIDGYLDAARIRQVLAKRYGCDAAWVELQERHLALAYQEALFDSVPDPGGRAVVLARVLGRSAPKDVSDPVSVQNAIRSSLMKAGKPAYVEERFLSLDEGLDLIRRLGGEPCYPVIADGLEELSHFERAPHHLVEQLLGLGVRLAEFIPNRNSAECLERYVMPLREAGLVVTAGTEHNTTERLSLIPTCRNGEPIPQRVQEVFWEGACALAALQRRRLSEPTCAWRNPAELAEEGRGLLEA